MLLGQVFLPVFRFSPVSDIPPMLHSYIQINMLLLEGKMGGVWQPLKGSAVSVIVWHWIATCLYRRLALQSLKFNYKKQRV